MTRTEHLEWCKRRALEYIDRGDVHNAITSMMSDLGKHNETAPLAHKYAAMAIYSAMHDGPREAKHFIDGFR